MGDKLKVEFDDPKHGWMALTVRCDKRELTLVISCVPYYSLRDLADGLHALAITSDEVGVRWSEEPSICDMRFVRQNDLINVDVSRYQGMGRSLRNGTSLFSASGTYREVCVPFWRALRNLQVRFSPDDFETRWGSPFPLREMMRLTAVIEGKSS